MPQLMGALLPAWLLPLLVLVASTVATSTRADVVSMSRRTGTGTGDGSDNGSMCARSSMCFERGSSHACTRDLVVARKNILGTI